MVDGREGHARRVGERIGGDELPVRADEDRTCIAHVERFAPFLTERLAVHVHDVGRNGHRVRRVAGGGATDLERAAEVVDTQSGHGGIDVDPRRIERLAVEHVVELDGERGERSTRVEALRSLDVERRIRATGLPEILVTDEGAFERRNAGSDLDHDAGVRREGLGRHEGNGAAGECCVERSPGSDCGIEFAVGREADRVDGSGIEADRREHGVRVDTLIERGDEHGVESHRVRHSGQARRCCCRGGEREAHIVGERCAIDRFGARRHRHGVLGGCRQTVEGLVAVDAVLRTRLRRDLEAKRAGPDPTPATVDAGGVSDVGLDGDRHIGSVELLEGREFDHRLIEGQRDERCDVDVTLGLHAEHFERCVRIRIRHGWRVGRRRERGLDGLADGGRLQRVDRAVEVGDVLVGHVPLGEPVEHR